MGGQQGWASLSWCELSWLVAALVVVMPHLESHLWSAGSSQSISWGGEKGWEKSPWHLRALTSTFSSGMKSPLACIHDSCPLSMGTM